MKRRHLWFLLPLLSTAILAESMTYRFSPGIIVILWGLSVYLLILAFIKNEE